MSLYLLASYPKSGNVWFRQLLAHILNSSSEALELNDIFVGSHSGSRSWVDEALNFDSAYFSHDELDKLRPSVYEWYANQSPTRYHTIHDAYTYLPDGQALVPPEHCRGALYFIRNPLDVVISLANHINCTIDDAIVLMRTPDYAWYSGTKKRYMQLRQKLLSWSMHVKSWHEAKNMNMQVIRYEDMKKNPIDTLTQATRFLDLEVNQQRIAKALEHSIGRMQHIEQEHGFSENPVVSDYKHILTSQQIDQIIYDHGDIMKAYNYV